MVIKRIHIFILIALLVSVLTFPYYWEAIDQYVFYSLNQSLEKSLFLQQTIAILNSRIGDWISEILPLALYFRYIIEKQPDSWKKFIYMIFVTLFVMTIINKLLLFKIIDIERLSPSLVLNPSVLLSEIFPYLNNKDQSYRSFPADHATRIFLTTLFIMWHCPKKYGWIALLTAPIFIMPRLFSGAHWFTDVIFGGWVPACTFWLLATQTPLEKHFFNAWNIFLKRRQEA